MSLGHAPAKVYSVSEVASQIHDLLENSFPEIWIEGEISNCRAYPSGHTYMSLKDAEAQISAVLFKGMARGVRFTPKDGQKVLVRARVSSYMKRGDLQLIISAMEPRELGALQLALQQLKEKLAKEGLFDEERKKPIPPLSRRIGIVTSAAGAALHDMLTVLKSRWDGLEIRIMPVRVQGEGAKEEIAHAIAEFNRCYPETDVLLVGRGGGSIEDLWAFNEEEVARAIASSKIPIISCVGHETDVTVADLVADLRAPTPSAAAAAACAEKSGVLERVALLSDALFSAIKDKLTGLEHRLALAAAHPFLQSPRRLYEERVKRVDELSARLPEAMRQVLLHAEKDFQLQAQRLDAFSPLKVLSRGYSIVEKVPGPAIVRSYRQVKAGEPVRVRLHEGEIHCEVREVHEQRQG